MSNLETQSNNLENEFLKGLRNQTVVGYINNQVVARSKLLPHIIVLNNPGDNLKIVGLKSKLPKDYTWKYKSEEYGPDEVVTHKAEITDKDKKIFHTIFNEKIEEIAVGDKAQETRAKQAKQLASNVANYYDQLFFREHASDLSNYHENAIIKLNGEQLKDMQLVGELLITNGFQMTSPSKLYNKKGELCNVEDPKNLLLLIDYSLYGRGKVASIYTNPSPVLRELENTFTLIPCSLTNNVKAALIDKEALFMWTNFAERDFFKDGYVSAYKLLDHFWRKWIFVDHRPALAIVSDDEEEWNYNHEDNNEEYKGDLKVYLKNLKQDLSSFIKHDSGDIKKNVSEFFQKVIKDLKSFDSSDVKTSLTQILGEVNPGSDDSDKKSRFETVIAFFVDNKVIEKEEGSEEY